MTRLKVDKTPRWELPKAGAEAAKELWGGCLCLSRKEKEKSSWEEKHFKIKIKPKPFIFKYFLYEECSKLRIDNVLQRAIIS